MDVGRRGLVRAAAAAGDATGEAQFMLAMEDGRLWHTIRFADGSWQVPAGPADDAAGITGQVRAVAAAGGAPGEVQFVLAMEDDRLLHTIRFPDGSWQPAGDAGAEAGITGPVRAAAAASGAVI